LLVYVSLFQIYTPTLLLCITKTFEHFFLHLTNVISDTNPITATMSKVFIPGYGYVGKEDNPRVPKTPWRERYGGFSYPQFADAGQSGLRPLRPEIRQPSGTDETLDVLRRRRPEPLPSERELDEFFSERFQTQTCAGLRSWQLQALNQGIPELPLPFDINEADWYDVFQKHHWYDYITPADLNTPRPHKWGVDNPELWDELKVPIDMADRILALVIVETNWYVLAIITQPRAHIPS